MIIPSAPRRLFVVAGGVAVAAAIAGFFVALHYHQLALTLTHYDARGHLIVARRIVDSITPGWQQIGAVWLPLPHLLNAIPVQIDAFYRTGASAIAISIASFAVAAGSIASIVLAITESRLAAIAAATVFALNPNVLYLQSTPMTEPLLVALMTLSTAALMHPRGTGDDRIVGVLFALACLTRYEAWPVTAATLTLAAVTDSRRAVRIAVYPALAIVGFSVFSRVVVGQWFVAGDFFVPENKATGDLWMTIKEIAWGVRELSSAPLIWLGGIGLATLSVVAIVDRARAFVLLPVALLASAAIPTAAFYRGHPYRIRYMIPLLAIEAIGCGALAVVARKARVPIAVGVLALAVATLRPLDARAPMVLEAQWDAPNLPLRAQVTKCIGTLGAGQKIMASMGSLGHYMQEASADGLQLRDFLHEGNGDIWLAAIEQPRPFAGWILIEEKAEGGDMLAHIAKKNPRFLDGYERLCEGAGLVLYRRKA